MFTGNAAQTINHDDIKAAEKRIVENIQNENFFDLVDQVAKKEVENPCFYSWTAISVEHLKLTNALHHHQNKNNGIDIYHSLVSLCARYLLAAHKGLPQFGYQFGDTVKQLQAQRLI